MVQYAKSYAFSSGYLFLCDTTHQFILEDESINDYWYNGGRIRATQRGLIGGIYLGFSSTYKVGRSLDELLSPDMSAGTAGYLGLGLTFGFNSGIMNIIQDNQNSR
jgi:hypothetical protein